MARKPNYEKLSVFEQLKRGLEESIAHSRGQLSLRTTALPAPPPKASPQRVAALRRKLKMSQSVFAALLNVSPKLVQSWEQGTRTPMRADLRLIQIVEGNPAVVAPLIAIPSARRKGVARRGGRSRSLTSVSTASPTVSRRSSAA